MPLKSASDNARFSPRAVPVIGPLDFCAATLRQIMEGKLPPAADEPRGIRSSCELKLTDLDLLASVNYSSRMIEVRQTDEFRKWLRDLTDIRAARKIAQRLIRVEAGLLGDAKFFDGIGELRIDYGPGYRVYFIRRGNTVIILLCGGDKSSQDRDIRKAKQMANEV